MKVQGLFKMVLFPLGIMSRHAELIYKQLSIIYNFMQVFFLTITYWCVHADTMFGTQYLSNETVDSIY